MAAIADPGGVTYLYNRITYQAAGPQRGIRVNLKNKPWIYHVTEG